MKNILHLSETSEPGGSETVLANIAANINSKNYRSYACLLEIGWLPDRLDELGIENRIIPNNRPYDPVFLYKLIRLIREKKIALIHAHEFMMNVYGSIAGRLTGIPMIGTLHGKVYIGEKRTRIYAYKLALALCSRMIVVSEDLRAFFLETLGIGDRGKILTIYNGIDQSLYKYTESGNQLRIDLEISSDSVVVGSVGSVFEVKGFPYLLEGLKDVSEKAPNVVLLIVGEGNQSQILSEKAKALGIEDRVRFLGFRKDIPSILSIFDIYVCSSLSEGLSLSILEAMAVSRPIIATDVGGNPELVADGENGFLVSPKNPQALADKILYLLRNKDEGREMGEYSRRIVENRFSQSTMIENYENLYAELIG